MSHRIDGKTLAILVLFCTCGVTALGAAGHRITVQNIALWHERLGLSADEIADQYGISLADIYAALAYYHERRAEIDAAIHADDGFVEELRQRFPSKLLDRLQGAAP
jgi:uncharacterized protein (DUF433 family)